MNWTIAALVALLTSPLGSPAMAQESVPAPRSADFPPNAQLLSMTEAVALSPPELGRRLFGEQARDVTWRRVYASPQPAPASYLSSVELREPFRAAGGGLCVTRSFQAGFWPGTMARPLPTPASPTLMQDGRIIRVYRVVGPSPDTAAACAALPPESGGFNLSTTTGDFTRLEDFPYDDQVAGRAVGHIQTLSQVAPAADAPFPITCDVADAVPGQPSAVTRRPCTAAQTRALRDRIADFSPQNIRLVTALSCDGAPALDCWRISFGNLNYIYTTIVEIRAPGGTIAAVKFTHMGEYGGGPGWNPRITPPPRPPAI